MSSVRLLLAAVILSYPWLFAQDHPLNPSHLPATSNLDPISPTGPLRIDPLASAPAIVPQNPWLSFQAADPSRLGQEQVQMKVLDVQEAGNIAIAPDSLADHYCLKIRSYLMARDSRSSDSTHLVGYSTCLPASRYRLRTAVESTQPALSH